MRRFGTLARRALGCLLALLLTTGCTARDRPDTATPTTSAAGSPTSTAAPTTTATATTPRPIPAPETCAQSTLAGMDPAQRVGQLLMVGVAATDPVGAYAAVAPYDVGGIFLAGRSSAGVTATRRAVDQLQEAALASTGAYLQVAADQEGGLVQTLSGPGFSDIPSAVEQGSWALPELSEQITGWAGELAAAGVTFNLSPVADTVPAGRAATNPPIGAVDRHFGTDPGAVAAQISTVVAASESAGVAVTLKHFPGLGRVEVNTDTAVGAADTETTATDPRLYPFRVGIDAGATAVMISSARYPLLDPDTLAPFSPAVIQDLLRGQLRYEGVVISDDLGRAAAVQSLPAGQRAVEFVAAGGDVVLTVVAADAEPMTTALLAHASSDAGFAARVEESALRVLSAKQRGGLLRC
ncbi:glycoside hydrolase family 3 protein [soil metagenome]